MKTLNENERFNYLLQLDKLMEDFLMTLPETHGIGYIPDQLSTRMAKAALTVIETVVDCNIYFNENPVTLPE